MRRYAAGIGVGLLLCSGCTTILAAEPAAGRGEFQPIGGAVWVNGSPSGQTPTTINLDKKLTYTVEVQRAGHAPYQQMLTKTVDPLFFLNILLLPGFIVDLVTGTWEKFPDQVMAPMVPWRRIGESAAMREG